MTGPIFLDPMGADGEQETRAPSSPLDETRVEPSTPSAGPGLLDVSPGSKIGRYLVIAELGRGGMGVVLRAYDPRLRRDVALKCVRPTAMSPEVEARMVQEALALAKLNHPNVVGVYDVEVVAGSVVIAMEYVEGEHFRAWTRRTEPGWREIVNAFLDAGQGLVAAHRAGLLHRDFKPTNVLRTSEGQVKVIDFGIARVDDDDGDPAVVAARTPASGESSSSVSVRLTSAGEVIGTPPFMAPEQHATTDVGPAADQYAFCAAMWQALSGQLPYGPGRDLRALLEAKLAGPPSWPMGAPRIPRVLIQVLRRGLAPDPEHRWPTMESLLTELSRDRSARQRRLSVVGAVIALAAGGFGWQAIDRAQITRDCEAEAQAIEQAWTTERAEGIARAFEDANASYGPDTWSRAQPRVDAHAERWADARATVCRMSRLEGTLDPDLTARAESCLDEQLARLSALADQWEEADGSVLNRAANAAWSLPAPDDCTDRHALRLQAPPDDDLVRRARAQDVREQLARALASSQLGRYDQSLELANEAHAEALELGDPRVIAATLRSIGITQDHRAQYEAARRSLEDAYYFAEEAGDDVGALLAASHLVLTVGHNQARFDEGWRWGQLALRKHARLGLSEDEPIHAGILSHLGVALLTEGRVEDARDHHARALEIRERMMGPEHPEVATSLNNMGLVHLRADEHQEADAVLRRAMGIWEQALSPEHPRVGIAQMNLGALAFNRGDLDQAQRDWERTVEIWERSLGPLHPDIASLESNLGLVHARRGDRAKARASYERALEILEHTEGPTSPALMVVLSNLGQAQLGDGDVEQAWASSRRAMEIMEATKGLDDPSAVVHWCDLGNIEEEREHLSAAYEAFERGRAILEGAEDEDPQRMAELLRGQGRVLLAQERPAEAVVPLERAVELHRAHDSTRPHVRAKAEALLARALWDSGGDRARARSMAEAALTDHEDRAQVQRWLDEHL